jgi:hypothetical protein
MTALVRSLMGALLLASVLTATATAAAADSGCGTVAKSTCGLHGDADHGDFHGLILVTGDPSVLDLAASSGSQAGCGDCDWTLVLACPYATPTHGAGDLPCEPGLALGCAHGALPYRLYLSTSTEPAHLVDMLCLGGSSQVLPVGDVAAGDVDRWLRTVDPPDLELRVQPPRGAITGLPTYFMVRAPAAVRPVPFGSGEITETVSIAPTSYRWVWGDGGGTGWITDPGGPWPDGTLTHTYDAAGRVRGSVTARWGGRYTVTVQGRVFGPYEATGSVTHTQSFTLPVASAHTHLVS